MAAGAGAGVRRRGVGHLVGIGGVAAGAAQGGTMRARVGSAGVLEADEAPVREAVTGGAVEPGEHMPGRQAGGAAVVVAGGAATGKARVIDPGGFPGERAVADIALLGRRDVGARHADGLHTVVAAAAGMRGDRGVSEARRRPGIGGVAAVAAGARGEVARGLAGRDDPVVAAGTAAAHLGVIHRSDRQPGERRVTALTGVGGRDVSRGFAAAARGAVTGDTG